MPSRDETVVTLLRAIAHGDRRAFGELYDLLAPQLLGVAMRLLRRRDLAEDALQEAFVKIWTNAARYDPSRGAATAWLVVMVRRCAIDRLRRSPPVGPTLDELTADEVSQRLSIDPARSFDHAEDIRRCLDGLSEEHRNALLLAYTEGLTHEEIAARLAVPLGTAKSWVRRAALRMKACLEG
jgi:RNA polymerase sigma-70 factor (ECF subfamily)